jgi:urease accessory protein UreH
MDPARAAVRVDSREPAAIGRRARLELVFRRRGDRTVLAHAYAEPPFHVGRLVDAGSFAHLVIVCSGPGVFAGDQFEQRVRVERGARVLLVSQSALQVHPSGMASPPACLDCSYEVDRNSVLDCFWDPLIPFAGARLRQRIALRVAAGGELFWSDAMMSGRAARGETWCFESMEHELRLTCRGSLQYLERYTLVPGAGSPSRPWVMGRANYLGTTIFYSPGATNGASLNQRARSASDVAEAAQHEILSIGDVQGGVDLLGPELIVARLMSRRGPPFAAARSRLRATLGRPEFRRAV